MKSHWPQLRAFFLDSAAICFLAVVVLSSSFLVSQELTGASFRFERSRILTGEWWRMFSAHFDHASFAHWLGNMMALAAVLFIYREVYKLGTFLVVGLCLVMGVSLGLLFLKPSLDWYLGFSAVIHGLFAFGAARSLRERSVVQTVSLALVLCKVAYEKWRGGRQSLLFDLPIAVEAHLYGVLIGVLLGLMSAGRSRLLTKADSCRAD